MSVAVKTRRKQRKAISFTVAVLLAIFTAAALIFSRYTGDAPTEYPDVDGQDESAYDMELSFIDTVLGVKKNQPDTFSYEIKKDIKIDVSDNKGVAFITNPPQNNCLMAVEITLWEEDEVIYRSGYIKPNQRIDEIELLTHLDGGTYDVAVYFCAVDFESFELLGILEENITVTVE